MLGATTISNPMVGIPASNDWITLIPTCYLWVSTTATFDIIGEVVLTRGQWCSIQWLHVGIFYGAECGCEYTFGSLLLIWIDGRIYWLFYLNWLPNSMPSNLLWIARIPSSCSCGWSINVRATFCNSTCLTIGALM